ARVRRGPRGAQVFRREARDVQGGRISQGGKRERTSMAPPWVRTGPSQARCHSWTCRNHCKKSVPGPAARPAAQTSVSVEQRNDGEVAAEASGPRGELLRRRAHDGDRVGNLR